MEPFNSQTISVDQNPGQTASILSELNYINSNRPKLFLETYKAKDYVESRKLHEKFIMDVPKEGYASQAKFNKLMRSQNTKTSWYALFV